MKHQPAPDPAVLVPWSRTRRLQDRERQCLLLVRHPARGTWSRPGQTQTPLGKHPESAPGAVLSGACHSRCRAGRTPCPPRLCSRAPGLAPQHPAATRSLGAGRGCLRTAQVSSSRLSLVFSGQKPLQMRHSSDPSVHPAGRASGGRGCWPTGPARCPGQCLCLWVACAASVWPGCCSGPGRPGSLTPTPPSPAPGTRVPPPLGAFSESAGGGGRPGPEGPP